MPVQLGAPASDNTLTVEASPRRSSAKAKQLPKPAKAKAANRPIAKAKVPF